MLFQKLWPQYTLKDVLDTLTPLQFYFMVEQGAIQQASETRERVLTTRMAVAACLDKKCADELKKFINRLDEVCSNSRSSKVGPEEVKQMRL